MAVTQSGLFVPTFRDALKNALSGFNLTSANLKLALFNNSITPNFDTDASYGTGTFAAGNEVSGTGWAAGGVTLATPAFAGTGSGLVTFSCGNISQANVTVSGARCGLIYQSDLTNKNAIALINFGADYGATNGNFSITWGASGVFALDLA